MNVPSRISFSTSSRAEFEAGIDDIVFPGPDAGGGGGGGGGGVRAGGGVCAMSCDDGLKSHFFKQKTAYEITVRDWSSDVCSSDLMVFICIRRYDFSIINETNSPDE